MPLLFAAGFFNLLIALVLWSQTPESSVAMVVFAVVLILGSMRLGPNASQPLYTSDAWLALAVQAVLVAETILIDYSFARQVVMWGRGDAIILVVAVGFTLFSLSTLAELRGWKKRRGE